MPIELHPWAGMTAGRAELDVVAGGLVRPVGAVGVAVAVKVPRDALAAQALELSAAALLPRAEVGGLVLGGRPRVRGAVEVAVAEPRARDAPLAPRAQELLLENRQKCKSLYVVKARQDC